MSRRRAAALLAAAFGPLLAASAALADTIRVGVTIAATGPAASLGMPQQKTIALLPKRIAGQDVEYIVLDDATDTGRAVANTRKLIDEERVDVVLGSSTTPSSMAMVDVAAEKKVPMISLAASARIIAPMDATRHWVFKIPQNDSLMADAIAAHMAASGVRTVGFIGYNDAYGDGWLAETERAAKAHGLTLAAVERYARTDTSVTGQVLKLMAAKPDAVLIVGAGTPAALPQKTLKERGYAGKYYQTHGIANNDFLRVGGKDVEGTILPSGPILVAAQLPDDNPIKKVALEYIRQYEERNGPGSVSAFGSYAYDAGLWLQAAVPAALQKGAPGTPAFRAALRDALEAQRELATTTGIVTLSPQDHNGLDERAREMVVIRNGTWALLR